MSFYDKFKALCAEKGISTSRAAEDCGISRASVSRWKSDGYKPSAENLLKIAAYFEVPVSYFGENEIKTPEFNLQLFAVAQERALLDTFRSLDEVGKAKLLVYASELAQS